MRSTRTRMRHIRREAGLTLVELLVAMTLGLIVTIAAISMLILSRDGLGAVDGSTQLLDKERFALDLISKVTMQAGYEDYGNATLATRSVAVASGQDPEPDIFGWNNAVYATLDDLAITASTDISDGSRASGCGTVTDTSCRNGSDILVVRFHGSGPVGAADGSMINCMGRGEPGLPSSDLNQRAASIFYINRETATGEPSLYCTYYGFGGTPAWVAGQPVVEGVESLQVLYGTDNVTANTVPGAAGDTIVDRWLRADQLKVAGDLVATRENWRRVRAVRVGLLLRGPVGSGSQAATNTFYPLGESYDSNDDAGTALAVATDGRLRRVVNFTIHLRNGLNAQ